MRLIEKCCCGASIEVAYRPWGIGPEDEAGQAQDAVNTFRDRHRACLPSHPALEPEVGSTHQESIARAQQMPQTKPVG